MKYLPNQTSFIDDEEDFTQKKEKCNQCGKTATSIFADESLCNNCQGVAKLVRDKADAEKGAMNELIELAEKTEKHAIWYEYNGMHHAPIVDKNKFGSHEFIGPDGSTSHCKYGCGCWMGPSRSGGPVDPWGACPNNPIQPSIDERFIVINDDEQRATFAKELQNLLNRHSIENESDTPDWILAEYIRKILEAWNSSVLQRDKWYGHTLSSDFQFRKPNHS